MPLNPGTRLGSHEISAPLGAGGMGEVYRARDLRLGRDVALKVLPAELASDAARLARFELEARAVAALNHPNIVTIYAVEDAGGTRFLTMELVEGETLGRHVTPGGMELTRVLEIGIALADALAAAHAKGVVHRDLKPANVMLTPDGRVKVLDFGLAKLVGSEPPPGMSPAEATEAATIASPLSTAGQLLGTLPYMAPEQLRGEEIDHRADLFALGVILYELATGRRPFQGATQGVLCSAILRDTPSNVSDQRAGTPPGLDRVIAHCLEKLPAARFASALDLRDALRGLEAFGGPPVDADRPPDSGALMVRPPPAPSTALLGREETLASAARAVRAGARVLTVTGYGGTGKTRFAIELFHRLAPEYRGGAAFVSLASVTAAADVLPAVAAAVGIAEAHGRSPLEALCAVVGNRRLLLVLDNLEQVLDAAGDIAALVSRCEGLTLVATSRAPLKIGAETEFGLPPLELPAPGRHSTAELLACPSVALFAQRAEKVRPGFRLEDTNAEAIAGICRRLDGLPLALELAAARVRSLDPAALLRRLDNALDLLTSGDRDLPLRQRTLRATISWSYSLLDPSEQRLLRRLSVFHEGWTLESMERSCYGEADAHRALDELDSLVEKGLIRVIGNGERYGLLETVRAFAAEQLHASGETEAARTAHADHFLAFAAGVAADLRRPTQLEAMRRARGESANTLAAGQWLCAQARIGDPAALEKGLLLCGHLNWVWHICGLHLTARGLIDELLPPATSGPPTRGRALARLAAGMISTTTGEWERSLTEWAGGCADAAQVGDPEAEAEGWMGVGYCSLSLGRMDDARAALDTAIATSAGGVSDFIHALGHAIKGMLLFATGQLDAGIALVEHACAIHRRLGDHEGGGVALSFLAQMTFAKGDHARALTLYHEALELLEAVGDHPEIARVHCELGWTALAGGEAGEARDAFVRAIRAYDVVGSPRGTGLALMGLAAVEASRGRPERAVAIAEAAEELSKRAGVVIAHPMDPGLAGRIDALKASIPSGALEGLVARGRALSARQVLDLIADEGGTAALPERGVPHP